MKKMDKIMKNMNFYNTYNTILATKIAVESPDVHWIDPNHL